MPIHLNIHEIGYKWGSPAHYFLFPFQFPIYRLLFSLRYYYDSQFTNVPFLRMTLSGQLVIPSFVRSIQSTLSRLAARGSQVSIGSRMGACLLFRALELILTFIENVKCLGVGTNGGGRKRREGKGREGNGVCVSRINIILLYIPSVSHVPVYRFLFFCLRAVCLNEGITDGNAPSSTRPLQIGRILS